MPLCEIAPLELQPALLSKASHVDLFNQAARLIRIFRFVMAFRLLIASHLVCSTETEWV